MKKGSEFVSGMLDYLAEELDNPKMFPGKQPAFPCSGCGKIHSFGYVLRYISGRLQLAKQYGENHVDS